MSIFSGEEQIQRIARREVNQAITPLKQSNASLKKSIKDYKQRIVVLERERKKLAGQIGKTHVQIQDSIPKQEADDFQITGKQVRSLRGRLGISQMQLAKLLGVSGNIVGIWENKPGRLQIQKSEVRKALSDLKGKRKNDLIEEVERKKRGRKNAPVVINSPKKARVSKTANILELVQKSKKGISVEAVIKKTGASKSLVFNMLGKAKKAGKVSSVGRGVYGPA